MTFKVTRSTRWSKQFGQLCDRDYDGFVALNRTGGFKYASAFEGVSTSLAGPQNKKGIGVSRNVIVRDLKGVANFDL